MTLRRLSFRRLSFRRLSFRRVALLVLFGFGLLLSPAGPALAADPEFVLRNQSEAEVWHIYVSPDYASSWEDDLLGGQALRAGAQARIRLEGYEDHCIFDLRVEDSEGGAKDYFNLNLCRIGQIEYP